MEAIIAAQLCEDPEQVYRNENPSSPIDEVDKDKIKVGPDGLTDADKLWRFALIFIASMLVLMTCLGCCACHCWRR